MPEFPIKKVGMLILMEPDINSALLFYEQLGLHKQFELEGRWVEFLIGDIKLGLCATSHTSVDHRTGIVLEVDDLKLFHEQKKDKINFVREPVEAVHGIMATIKDPGGNLIDLYQSTPQRVKEVLSKNKT